MPFLKSVRSSLEKFATFSGRASRSEYWWFALFYVLVGIITPQLDLILGTGTGEAGPIEELSEIVLLVPFLAVMIRRIHDTGRSGWWWFTIFPPFVFIFMKGDEGPNLYGPSPPG